MKTFYSLLANNAVASIVSYTVWFAITFFVFLETNSVFATAVISGIYLTLTALCGIWFGSLVDRHKKKTMMFVSSLASLIFFGAAFALYLLAPAGAFQDAGSLHLWLFVLLLIAGVVVGNIRAIAMPTLVTLLVPEDRRDKANGLVGLAFGASFMVVSAISGILVGLSGMYHVLLLGVVGSLAVMIHLLFLADREKEIVHIEGASSGIDLRGTYVLVSAIPGLFALIFFTTFNNFLGGVFMALMDAYGLSLVSVEAWGIMWAALSSAFMIGGAIIARFGLGKNPLRALLLANLVIWAVSSVFAVYASIIPLLIGMFIYLVVMPYIEASEHTVIQKVVPVERQGRVFGFAQSIEQAASPATAFLIGPIAQFIFIPFMTDGVGAQMIGEWWGTGQARGIALLFTVTGLIGLSATLLAFRSRSYKLLSERYIGESARAHQ